MKETKPKGVPLVELECTLDNDYSHKFKTEKVWLFVDEKGKNDKTGFAICPTHNTLISIVLVPQNRNVLLNP